MRWSGERNLVVKNAATLLPDIFTGPSWSPDGKIIAASVLTVGGRTKVTGFLVADGSEKDLTPDSWTFARVQWMPDMSGLLVVAGDSPVSAMLWYVNYPDGRTRRVTNDLNAYRTIGLTQDGKKLASVQSQGMVNLWVVPEGDVKNAVRLPTEMSAVSYVNRKQRRVGA